VGECEDIAPLNPLGTVFIVTAPVNHVAGESVVSPDATPVDTPVWTRNAEPQNTETAAGAMTRRFTPS